MPRSNNLVTAHSIQKNVHQQRDIEDQRRQLQQYSVESNKLLSSAHSQAKVEGRRAQALLDASRNEQLQNEKIQQDEKNRRIQERQNAQRNAIESQAEKEYLGKKFV